MGTTNREREFRVWAAILGMTVLSYKTARVSDRSVAGFIRQIESANSGRRERIMGITHAAHIVENALIFLRDNAGKDDGYHSYRNGGTVSVNAYSYQCYTTKTAVFGTRLTGGSYLVAYRASEGNGKSDSSGITQANWVESKAGDSMGMMERAAKELFFVGSGSLSSGSHVAILEGFIADGESLALARMAVDCRDGQKVFADYIQDNGGLDLLSDAMRNCPRRAKTLCRYIIAFADKTAVV